MSKNEIIIDGVNVYDCDYIQRRLPCDFDSEESMEDYICLINKPIPCALHKDCYYKQLQSEKQINKKLKKTLKEIAEIAKTKIYTPVCFECPDCPKNGGVGFDNQCDEYCPLIIVEKILEKIKEVKNE